MAEEDPKTLTPPQRYARGFADALGLSVPVDIAAVLGERSDVEYDAFPAGVDCDAVVIRREGRRPRVVINTGRDEKRQRFTLAHELGHIVLPWQIGTIFCHARIAYRASDELIRQIETDAHQFASELLVPGAWVRANLPLAEVEPTQLSAALLDVASTAMVSVIAAAVSARRFLPTETMIIFTERGVVTYALAAPHSTCVEPERGSQFAAREYKNVGAALGSASYGNPDYGKVLHVVHFEPTSAGGARDATLSSRELFSEMLDDLGLGGVDRKRVQQTVAGIVGHANNLAEEAHPLSMLRRRFGGRTELRELIAHPRFGEFLTLKAEELRDPSRPRRRK